MANLEIHLDRSEHRQERRWPAQISATIKALDEKECEAERAMAVEYSESGAALVTHHPLPIGTPIEIRIGQQFTAIAEVADWNWEAETDTVRIGMRLVEKHGNWPTSPHRHQ